NGPLRARDALLLLALPRLEHELPADIGHLAELGHLRVERLRADLLEPRLQRRQPAPIGRDRGERRVVERLREPVVVVGRTAPRGLQALVLLAHPLVRARLARPHLLGRQILREDRAKPILLAGYERRELEAVADLPAIA